MEVKEYLDIFNNYQGPDREDKIIEYNKALVEEYPFVKLNKDYKWTWMDDMPSGWRIAFGKQMLDEIKAELIRCNFLDKYRVLEVKEKYGTLRWYDGGIPKDDCKIWDIIDKYEELSSHVCQKCGKTAEVVSKGWIGYYCGECAEKLKLHNLLKIGEETSE